MQRHPHSEETKRKISRALTGRKKTPKHCAHIQQAKMGKLCGPRSPEVREKIRSKLIGIKRTGAQLENNRLAQLGKHAGSLNSMYGKRHYSETLKKIRESKLGVCDTLKTREKKRLARLGPLNPRWRGGKSLEPYSPEWNGKLQEQIRDRDDHLCQMPGCYLPENGKKHDVHHIDYDKKHNQEENLITLCHKHHTKTTSGDRVYWTEYFQELQSQRGLAGGES